MFDVFGNFDSVEELNACAKGLLEEQDLEHLKVLAEENGIPDGIREVYEQHLSEELVDLVNAAIGKLQVELKAKIHMADGGDIVIELFEKEAPGTVQNFIDLINKGFYNGLRFHRVIPGFVAQGGCPNGNGTGGPGYTIKDELVGNPHKHERGALSMAHRGPNTGGSQFFIVYEPQPHLDGVHTVFGKVIEGMDVVDGIQQGAIMETVEVIEG